MQTSLHAYKILPLASHYIDNVLLCSTSIQGGSRIALRSQINHASSVIWAHINTLSINSAD